MLLPAELRLAQELAQRIWREAPRHLDMTMGELAYQGGLGASTTEDSSRHRLWVEDGRCRGWGWFFPPDTLEWAVEPESRPLLDEILDWFEEQAGPATLKVSARDADEAAQETLRARGFVDDPGMPWMKLSYKTLDEIEEPRLPTGYRLRTVADYNGDISKRVTVHRRSWAEMGTRVSVDTYPDVMRTWPYRSDLDFVLEADDGTPVAFALGWYDESNAVVEFEPFGTDPGYRQKGLGRALLLLGLERFRDAGATAALVASRGDEAYTIPARVYGSIGFTELSRQRWFVRRPSEARLRTGRRLQTRAAAPSAQMMVARGRACSRRSCRS